MVVRRAFLKNLLIGGVGVSILPWKLLMGHIQTPKFTFIDLPEPLEHVRHGNWRPQKHLIEGFPQWLGNYQHDVFFKNGMFSQTEDLEVFSFKIGEDNFDLILQQKEVMFIGKKDTLSMSLREEQYVNLIDNGAYFIDLLFFIKNSEYRVSRDIEVVICCLKGEAKMDFGTINKGQAIYVGEEELLKFISNDQQKFVLIMGKNIPPTIT